MSYLVGGAKLGSQAVEVRNQHTCGILLHGFSGRPVIVTIRDVPVGGELDSRQASRSLAGIDHLGRHHVARHGDGQESGDFTAVVDADDRDLKRKCILVN